jgi:zinc transport system ATP-binding protein
MKTFAVEVESLTVKYGEHFALENVHLSIPTNSFVAIVGPNGAGKSTFFKVLLNLVQPSEGKVRLYEKDPDQIPAEWVGYVPQAKSMDRSFPALAIELVTTGLNLRWPWRVKKDQYDLSLSALNRVGAAHLAERPISKLSEGELQRVCLARSFVRRPRLIMLDEPATGIDVVGEADLYNQLEAYQKDSGATILMITHDWHAATHHADCVLLLNRKQISFGPPNKALSEDNLRIAFGHIGHPHTLKFLVNSND